MASEQLQTVIKMLSNLPVDLDDADFAVQRKFMEKTLSLFPLPEDLQLQEVDADGVPCEWTSVPSASHDRTLLYLHGGGYVLGSVRTHRAMVGNISSAAGLRCLSVDYRLAPEHPHPAAVDDARTAYRWPLRSMPTSADCLLS
jgi:acetyl esterase/lipase